MSYLWNKTSSNFPTTKHIALQKPIVKKISPAINTHATEMTTEHKNDSELLNILHNAIAEQVTYPDSALASNETGTVKIGFFISPTGIITQIQLLKSSGYAAIDQAALTAVAAISPVNIYGLLAKTEFLSLDVIFQT